MLMAARRLAASRSPEQLTAFALVVMEQAFGTGLVEGEGVGGTGVALQVDAEAAGENLQQFAVDAAGSERLKRFRRFQAMAQHPSRRQPSRRGRSLIHQLLSLSISIASAAPRGTGTIDSGPDVSIDRRVACARRASMAAI